MVLHSWGTWEINASHWQKTQTLICASALSFGLAACTAGGLSRDPDSPYAPGVDTRKEAVDGLEVGHRLIDAGQYELALEAFNRAALENGMTAEILSGLGTANLGLGRLGQAETLLRRAIEQDETRPEIWNNLGVVLMEEGKTAESVQVFRKAFALDDGKSDSIRDNLRLAIEKSEISDNSDIEGEEYKLVRRGGGDFLIQTTP
jgi:tetratricopeptide (TPR) repeat protein